MFWQAEEAAVLRACQPTRGSVMLMVDPWEPDGRQHPLDNWSDPIALEKRESWNKKEKYVTGSPGWTGWSEIAVYAKTQLFECDTRMDRSKDINLFIIYVCTEVPYSVVTEHFYLCTMVSREKWDSFYGKRGTRDENVSRGKKMWKECECEKMWNVKKIPSRGKKMCLVRYIPRETWTDDMSREQSDTLWETWRVASSDKHHASRDKRYLPL